MKKKSNFEELHNNYGCIEYNQEKPGAQSPQNNSKSFI